MRFRSSLGLCLGLGLALASALALAQTPQQVIPLPQRLTTASSVGTISVTNTFQSALAAVASPLRRTGCLILNTSTNVQYVYFGAPANSSTPKSIPLNPALTAGRGGGWVNCSSPDGGVIADQISITGTAGDTFVVISTQASQ